MIYLKFSLFVSFSKNFRKLFFTEPEDGSPKYFSLKFKLLWTPFTERERENKFNIRLNSKLRFLQSCLCLYKPFKRHKIWNCRLESVQLEHTLFIENFYQDFWGNGKSRVSLLVFFTIWRLRNNSTELWKRNFLEPKIYWWKKVHCFNSSDENFSFSFSLSSIRLSTHNQPNYWWSVMM